MAYSTRLARRAGTDGTATRTLTCFDELTAHGLNLAGVKRVLELEAEVFRLASELDMARAEVEAAVAEVHRTYRRDLVPLHQSVTLFRREKLT